MIWQLMKLDPAWVWTAILSLVGIFFGALGGSFIVGALLLFACGVALSQRTDAEFYAALPVTSRQVYLERTLSLNALLWLPLAISGQMFMLASRGSVSGGSMIAIGSVLMLVLQAILAAKFRRRHAPGWLTVVPVAIWLTFSVFPGLPALVAPWQSWLLRQAARTAAPVTVICWLLTGILFAREFAVADSSASCRVHARRMAKGCRSFASRFTRHDRSGDQFYRSALLGSGRRIPAAGIYR